MTAAIEEQNDEPAVRRRTAGSSTRVAAAGSALTSVAAFLTASCCAFPLIFVILGLGGAWLSIFDALLPYRYYFITPALVAVGLSWGLLLIQRYRTGRACRTDGVCARPATSRFAFRMLAVSTVLVIGAVLISEYQGDVTRSLFELRQWLKT